MGDDAIVGYGRMSGNKRHRADAAEWRSNDIRGKVSQIVPGKDLRFKLIRKHGSLHFKEAFEDGRRDSEKLLKHVQPQLNLSKHMYGIGPNRITNPSQITCNGIVDGLHIYSMQTALARNDLFSCTGVLDPSRESGQCLIGKKL